MNSAFDRAADRESGINAMFERVALALQPRELSAAQRERMRLRVLAKVHDEPPAGTSTVRAGTVTWRQLGCGAEVLMLQHDERSGLQTVLLRVKPGGEIPRHRHIKDEEFIVLEGECRIGAHRLRAGDFHKATAGSWHDRTTTDTGVLVMLRGEYPAPQFVQL